MSFPIVQGVTTSTQAANSTTTVINLPPGVAAGELVLAFLGTDSGAGANTWPSPWVELKDDAGTGFEAGIAYLIASGGETSVTVTHSTERGNAIAMRISGWHGTTPPEVTTAATGSSTTPNPGSLTPSWGADDTLWIAAMFADDSAVPFPVTAWPTNYTDNQTQGSTAASACDVAIATRNLNAASEDPGTFTMTGTETWSAYTVAVRPAAAGGNVTATPDVKAVSVTKFAPTVSTPVTATPGVKSVSVTKFAPTATVASDQTATPSTKAISVSKFAPSVLTPVTVTPGVKAISATKLAPTVTASDNKVATPNVSVIVVQKLRPVIAATANVTATPTTPAIVVQKLRPVITVSGPAILGTATESVSLEHNAVATVGISSAAAANSLALLATATATVS